MIEAPDRGRAAWRAPAAGGADRPRLEVDSTNVAAARAAAEPHLVWQHQHAAPNRGRVMSELSIEDFCIALYCSFVRFEALAPEEEMGLSVHTIHFHRRNLRRVLGVDSEGGLERFGALLLTQEGWGEGG